MKATPDQAVAIYAKCNHKRPLQRLMNLSIAGTTRERARSVAPQGFADSPARSRQSAQAASWRSRRSAASITDTTAPPDLPLRRGRAAAELPARRRTDHRARILKHSPRFGIDPAAFTVHAPGRRLPDASRQPDSCKMASLVGTGYLSEVNSRIDNFSVSSAYSPVAPSLWRPWSARQR